MEPTDLEVLLTKFNIGTSTAENDPLLLPAKIETQEFYDLYHQDRIDLVRGAKGAGKTALYKVLWLLMDHAHEHSQILMSFGVETEGAPLFKSYASSFDRFSEDDFERFWYCYFIYLAVQALLEKSGSLHQGAQQLIDQIIGQFGPEVRQMFGKELSVQQRVAKWLKGFPWVKIDSLEAGVKTETKPTGTVSYQPTLRVNVKDGTKPQQEVFDAGLEIRDLLIKIADLSKIRVWILLDRLDEIFLRRSETEKRALRALLRAKYRFSEPRIRVKLFLREDIFETLAGEGFAALTHVADRSSGVMSWTERDLLRLVTKRLAAMPGVSTYYQFDAQKVEGNSDYQKSIFYRVFPQKIGGAATFEWLISSLKDGKDQVTPRDLIDLLNYARNSQLRIFEVERKSQESLIEEVALKEALAALSKDKRDKYLVAEFPHLKNDIFAFRGGFSDYTDADLEKILGTSWREKAETLKAIGFLKFDTKKALWKVPYIWRKGMDIRRGRVKSA